jgi:hypothetical protein
MIARFVRNINPYPPGDYPYLTAEMPRAQRIVGDIVKCCGSHLSGGVDRWGLSE